MLSGSFLVELMKKSHSLVGGMQLLAVAMSPQESSNLPKFWVVILKKKARVGPSCGKTPTFLHHGVLARRRVSHFSGESIKLAVQLRKPQLKVYKLNSQETGCPNRVPSEKECPLSRCLWSPIAIVQVFANHACRISCRFAVFVDPNPQTCSLSAKAFVCRSTQWKCLSCFVAPPDWSCIIWDALPAWILPLRVLSSHALFRLSLFRLSCFGRNVNLTGCHQQISGLSEPTYNCHF